MSARTKKNETPGITVKKFSPRSDSLAYAYPQRMKMQGKDFSHPLEMTMPVISNPSAVLRINSVRDLCSLLFSKEARRNTKGLINFNSELSDLRAFVVKL